MARAARCAPCFRRPSLVGDPPLLPHQVLSHCSVSSRRLLPPARLPPSARPPFPASLRASVYAGWLPAPARPASGSASPAVRCTLRATHGCSTSAPARLAASSSNESRCSRPSARPRDDGPTQAEDRHARAAIPPTAPSIEARHLPSTRMRVRGRGSPAARDCPRRCIHRRPCAAGRHPCRPAPRSSPHAQAEARASNPLLQHRVSRHRGSCSCAGSDARRDEAMAECARRPFVDVPP